MKPEILMSGRWWGIPAAACVLAGCGGGGGSSGGPAVVPPPPPVAAAPVFSLPAGTYTATQTVALSDSSPGAVIYYTLDGTPPSATTLRYSNPVTVASTETIQALAVAPGYTDSPVVQATYTITVAAPPVQTATPRISLPGGTYAGPQTITLTDATAGAVMYYTTDGITPTTASTRYSGPLVLSTSATLAVFAAAPGDTNSAVAAAQFIIQSATPAPVFATVAGAGVQNGAQLVALSDAAAGATIYYSVDGSTPTSASRQYLAPVLVASNVTIQAIAVASGTAASAVASQVFTPDIPSGTLVWSDEFSNTTGAPLVPNPVVWTYDVGAGGWGNGELEDYCAADSDVPPCASASPNAYVGTDGYLHIVAQQPSPGSYTSARLKTQGLFSFQYGRFEVRVAVPEAQGFWPAAWLLGNDFAIIGWPGCGEMDVQERFDAVTSPDFTIGSVHGPGFFGSNISQYYSFPGSETAATFHTYGMIWSPGSVAYYIDDPATPYVTFTPASIANFPGNSWPFDARDSFILLNLAIGGNPPGSPNGTTPFPSETLVDYVRIYAN